MTCSVCLSTTPELQEIGTSGRCPRCGTDYSRWAHVNSLTPMQQLYNSRTSRLVVKGDAFRDRLLAARLSLRSNA